MKFILTFLISALTVSAFAQTSSQREEAKRVILGSGSKKTSDSKSGDSRDVVLGGGNNGTAGGGTNGRYPEHYPTSREQQVYEINRQYDAKIWSIRNNRNLSSREKDRIIRQLEADRQRRLAEVNGTYHKDGRRNDDDRKGKKEKGNNGNHYGWEKGKGNPHKSS